MAVLASVAAVSLVVAIPASQAGSVGVSADPNTVTFQARSGETNAVVVPYPAQSLTLTDSGAELTAGSGCVSLAPNSANCGVHPNIDAHLGNKNDSAHISWAGLIRVWAGSGNDSVIADSFGQHAEVYGGPGNDDIDAEGEGGQLAAGGPGNDIVQVFAFGGQSSGFGGPGNDTITYGSAGLIGGLGPATLDGGNGDDTITIQPTGLGSDTVYGGRGDDYIDVRAGGADTVDCGPGTDVVLHDASDTIADNCEVALLS